MTEAEIAALRQIILNTINQRRGAGPKALADAITQRLVTDREFYYLPRILPGER